MMSSAVFPQQYGTEPFDDMATQLSADMDEVIVHEAAESGMFPVSGKSTRQYYTTTSCWSI